MSFDTKIINNRTKRQILGLSKLQKQPLEIISKSTPTENGSRKTPMIESFIKNDLIAFPNSTDIDNSPLPIKGINNVRIGGFRLPKFFTQSEFDITKSNVEENIYTPDTEGLASAISYTPEPFYKPEYINNIVGTSI